MRFRAGPWVRLRSGWATQSRLRFGGRDAYNNANDDLSFYSGNYGTAADRPTLYVYYNP